MLVSELITRLQSCDPNARVLIDKNDHILQGVVNDQMGEAVVVAQGVAYKILCENFGTDLWVSQYQWQYEPPGVPLTGQSAVYIGSGDAIVTPLWTKK